jgi:hypothetical protein
MVLRTHRKPRVTTGGQGQAHGPPEENSVYANEPLFTERWDNETKTWFEIPRRVKERKR